MAYIEAHAPESTWRKFPFTNSTGSELKAGDKHVENGKLGVVYEDTPDGEDGLLVVHVPTPGIDLPAASVSFTAGDEVTWDVADSEVNKDTANNVSIGYALKDAASGDATVRVALLDSLNIGVA